MKAFESCYQALHEYPEFTQWLDSLPTQIENNYRLLKHGDLPKWQEATKSLPDYFNCSYKLEDTIELGHSDNLTQSDQAILRKSLEALCPWRKGPFNFFGIVIETEWRSDWKWRRIKDHIDTLDDKLVLDVGCGSGYHLWRMREAGAKFVLGIDPSLLFWQQFVAQKHYLAEQPVHYLPLRSEDLPTRLSAFDTVFSMGVLYHRRSPLDHLIELRNALKPGGQLLLETLIIDSQRQNVLVPEGRYAMMRNVFFLPNVELLTRWLERCGFINIKVIDINQTSVEEQSVSDWVKAKSLKDFLDPNNLDLTIEGYPAPLRASITAYKDLKYQ